MARDREYYICKICGSWVVKSKIKNPICKDCKRKIKREEQKKKTMICALEGCSEKLVSGNNKRYCYLHKGMTPGQRRKESERLLKENSSCN